MGIGDRGLIKWRAATFMPDQGPMLKQAWLNDSKVERPILDDLQCEEIEQNILLAMEYASLVIIKIKNDGFFREYQGLLHRMDEINQFLYLETEEGVMIKIPFKDIVEAWGQNT